MAWNLNKKEKSLPFLPFGPKAQLISPLGLPYFFFPTATQLPPLSLFSARWPSHPSPPLSPSTSRPSREACSRAPSH